MSFYPFVLHEISVLVELILGHLRYLLTDVPPQPNSPPDNVFHLDRAEALGSRSRDRVPPPSNGISKTTLKVVVFHLCRSSHLFSVGPALTIARRHTREPASLTGVSILLSQGPLGLSAGNEVAPASSARAIPRWGPTISYAAQALLLWATDHHVVCELRPSAAATTQP